jgi:hypothetical protein
MASNCEKFGRILLAPGYMLEQAAFNPESQSQYQIVREVLPRVTAVVSPFLHTYQVLLHGAGTCLGCGGEVSVLAAQSTCFSIQNAFSSLAEIPSRMWYGPNSRANYWGIEQRYEMADQRFWVKALNNLP